MSLFQTTYDPSTKTWSGRPMAPIYHPNVNAAQVLLDALHRNPNKVGQINVNRGVELTNQEIATNTVRVAQHLDRLMGIRSGDVLTLMAGNHQHVASVVFAGIALGASINILGTNASKDELVHMLGVTKPKILFCEHTNLDRAHQALAELGLTAQLFTFDKHDNARHVDELLLETGIENDFIPTLLADGQNHAAIILCTSGTTGPSKAIPISHATLLYQFNQQLTLDTDDVYFIPTSLVWLTAVMALVSTTLRGATRAVTEHDLSAEQQLQILAKFRISSTFINLYTLALMLQSPLIETVDLSSMKRLGCGGCVVSDLHRARMNQYLPNGKVIVFYGLTEVPGCTAVGEFTAPATSVGFLVPGQRVRVLDDSGNPCGPNEEGELAVKCEHLIMGYWQDALNTKRLLDEDGFAVTGDIGRFDAHGCLFITDRKKEMLRYRGDNVSPALVENTVLSIQGVVAVCVVGVFDDDVEELPTVVIVLDGRHEVTEQMVLDLVEVTLSEKGFLCGGVHFVADLPRTHSGKVQRRGVKALATKLYKDRIGQ